MAVRRKLDHQPGALPDIQMIDDSVIFGFDVPDAPDGSRLILRCDARGDVWASIEAVSSPAPGSPFTAGD